VDSFLIFMVMRQRIHINSFVQIIVLLCILNEGKFKAGFVKKLKLKDGSVPTVHDPAAPPEVVSLTLYIYFVMIICESPLLLHGREGRSEQSSLSHKEICKTKQGAMNRPVFDKVKRVLFYTTTETISRRP